MEIYCVLDIDGDIVLATLDIEKAYKRAKDADSGLIEVWEDNEHTKNIRTKDVIY